MPVLKIREIHRFIETWKSARIIADFIGQVEFADAAFNICEIRYATFAQLLHRARNINMHRGPLRDDEAAFCAKKSRGLHSDFGKEEVAAVTDKGRHPAEQPPADKLLLDFCALCLEGKTAKVGALYSGVPGIRDSKLVRSEEVNRKH